MPQIVPGQPLVIPFPNLSELQRQALAAPKILALATSIPVTNAAQCHTANEALKDLLRARDQLEKDRTDVTGPLHKTKTWIDAQYRPVRTMLDSAVNILKAKVSGFTLALEAEKAEQFRLAQQAMAAGDHTGMAQALNESSAIQTGAPEGTSVRQVWTAEVVNPSIVPYGFLCPDLDKIGGHAANTPITSEPVPIPGVRFEKRAITTVRR